MSVAKQDSHAERLADEQLREAGESVGAADLVLLQWYLDNVEVHIEVIDFLEILALRGSSRRAQVARVRRNVVWRRIR